MAVIGEGHAAVLDHIAHLGDDLALEALRHGTGGVHAAVALGGGDGLDVLDHDAVVGHGSWCWAWSHTPVKHPCAAAGGLGLDVALGLKAGLAQMHVHVHQTGDEIPAGKIDDFGSIAREVLADSGDLVALDEHVYTSVKLDGRVDDVGILKKQGHYRHLQAADTGQPCARRYRRTPGRG